MSFNETVVTVSFLGLLFLANQIHLSRWSACYICNLHLFVKQWKTFCVVWINSSNFNLVSELGGEGADKRKIPAGHYNVRCENCMQRGVWKSVSVKICGLFYDFMKIGFFCVRKSCCMKVFFWKAWSVILCMRESPARGESSVTVNWRAWNLHCLIGVWRAWYIPAWSLRLDANACVSLIL